MKKLLCICLTLAMLLTWLLAGCAEETVPTMNIMQTSKDEPMFSFSYGGREFCSLLQDWDYSTQTTKMDSYTLETAIWRDPTTGLQITIDTKRWENGTAQWVAHLENTGTSNSWLITDFQIADFTIPTEAAQEVTLSYSKGTDIRADDFLLVEQELKLNDAVTLSPNGGRSSSGDCMPYFNVHTENAGYVVAIGWTGQWQAQFDRNSDGLRVQAGMETTRFVLYPGESVRTPSVTVMPWSGNETDSYNQWRAFMLSNHTPKDENGDIVTLPVTHGSWGGDGTEALKNTISFIQSQGYDYDALWVDAGWFGEESRHSADQYGDAWQKNTGDWYYNTVLYPNGIKEVSDAAHDAGMDFLLWFEPERAWCESRIVQEHPEWFLNTGKTTNTSFLFNMGDDEAREWMTDFISSLIQQYGVDIYRQDFNIDPLPFWEANDENDRQGISEMKYIDGLYQFLEGLLEKNPGLILDNCAGGGRRLDYEILTYALPMFRSDYQCFTTYETTPCQVQTDGLSHWIPVSGTCVQYRPGDTYSFRSNLAYAVQFPASEQTVWQKAMLEQFHRAQPYFTGDYYCLTDGDITDNTSWYAYQMARDDLQGGFILAFRREGAALGRKDLTIHVPSGATSITFTDADTGEEWTEQISDAQNQQTTLTVVIKTEKSSRLIFYTIN